MSSIVNLVDSSNIQNNPIRKVKEFIDRQNQYKSVSDVDHWRFVGYVLDISYETAQIMNFNPDNEFTYDFSKYENLNELMIVSDIFTCEVLIDLTSCHAKTIPAV